MRITAGATSVRAFEQPLREAAAVARNDAGRRGRRPLEREPERMRDRRRIRHQRRRGRSPSASSPRKPRTARRRSRPRAAPDGQRPADRRADAAARRSRQGRWQLALRRRRAAARTCCSPRSRMAPPGGRLTGFAREAIAQAPGVRHVAARDDWIAVVADSWWAAEQRAESSRPELLRHAHAGRLAAAVRRCAGERRRRREWFSRGDYDATVRGSRPLAATYYVAPSQHLGLEPLTATARFRAAALEVWAPTQAPGFAHAAAGGARVALPDAGRRTRRPRARSRCNAVSRSSWRAS